LSKGKLFIFLIDAQEFVEDGKISFAGNNTKTVFTGQRQWFDYPNPETESIAK